MHRRYRANFCCVLGLACLVAFSSCNRDADPNDHRGEPKSQILPLKKVPQVESPLGPYLPILDEGRIRVAIPKGWIVSPRSKNHVCQFVRSRSAQVLLPRIRITVETADPEIWEGWESVTDDRVEAFAKVISERLNPKTIIEPVRPMIIGEHACARYVDAARFRFRDELGNVRAVEAQRQVIQIIHDGRLYNIELHIRPGRILDFRDNAYAVVAGIQFVNAADQTQTKDEPEKETATEETATEETAEKSAEKATEKVD